MEDDLQYLNELGFVKNGYYFRNQRLTMAYHVMSKSWVLQSYHGLFPLIPLGGLRSSLKQAIKNTKERYIKEAEEIISTIEMINSL